MKKIVLVLMCLYLLFSCGMQGPNYNKDKYRQKIVMKEDRRMRKEMIRARKRGARAIRLSGKTKMNIVRKIV